MHEHLKVPGRDGEKLTTALRVRSDFVSGIEFGEELEPATQPASDGGRRKAASIFPRETPQAER
jgi:hypothetical protein